MSSSESRLAARYRRLLRWYPRDYRRERGEEMVSLLLELAPPEQSRPPIQHRLNLIGNGLRCRLGRPASHTVVIAAALASLVCGLFAAALSIRVAWETAKPLPNDAEAAEIFEEVLPEYDLTGAILRSPAMFVVYQQPLTSETFHDLLAGDGGEYELGVVNGSAPVLWPVDLGPVFAGAAQRLTAGGWSIGEVSEPDAASPGGYEKLTARRGADIVELSASPDGQAGVTYVAVTISRATPLAAYPAGVVGGLLGAFAGWLVFGWASRRTEHQHIVVRGLTMILYRLTMLFWWSPILIFGPLVFWRTVHEREIRWPQLWEWLGQPGDFPMFLVGCAAGGGALAIAGLSRRKRMTAANWPDPEPVPHIDPTQQWDGPSQSVVAVKAAAGGVDGGSAESATGAAGDVLDHTAMAMPPILVGYWRRRHRRHE